MGTVEVRLFGAPEIRRDGEPVTVDTRKAIALLAVLAVEGRAVRRDVLAARMWPDADQERARGSLRRTLSALRSGIGSGAIVADRESITLDVEPGSVDVVAFAACERTDPATAIGLYRGEFLEGFSLGDSPEFEDWQRDRALEFRQRADALLAALAADAEPEHAVELTRRRRTLDPLNEAACRQAMAALAAVGDRSAAIATYRDLVGRLDAELGVEPLAETTEAYEAIRGGSSVAATADPPPTRRPVPRSEEPPLVGRAGALEALAEAVSDHAFVLVLGEPGVGRSRLLTEWAGTLDDRVLLRCHPGEQHVPYAPFAAWIGDASAGATVGWFDELAATLPLPNGGVLAIDDLQFADPATMAFLTYVAHRPERFGWTVVGTWRAPQVGPGDACWDLVQRGRRDGWAAEVHLGRLDGADTRALIGSIAEVTDARAAGIVEISEGLPLVAVESVRLRREHDGLPPAVDDLMRSRLAELSPLARQVVEALSVIERPAAVRLVRSVAGRTEPEVASAVDELVAADVVRESEGSLRLAHGLLGTVAVRSLSETRRRTLHVRAGRVLPAAEAADHLARAGRDDEAADRHLEAADDSLGTHALGAALRHLESALALGRSDDGDIHRRIADIETTLGHYSAARRAYEIAAAKSTGARLALLELLLARLALRNLDPALAASHLDSADVELDRVSGAATERLGTEIAVARALTIAAGGGDARAAAAHAIELSHAADDVAVEAEAEAAAALVALRADDLADASTRARRAVRLARLADAPLLEAAAVNVLGLAESGDERVDEAVACFERALPILRQHGDIHRLAAVHGNLAEALHVAGREQESRRHQLESARLLSEVSGTPSDGRAAVWHLTAW